MRNNLDRQLSFLVEADKLKSIVRQSPLIDRSRRENSAEHSWHLALYALVLAEHANESVDVGRVVGMLLVHDLVEIDAGDCPIHSPRPHIDQESRERAAADRLFGLLPETQGANLKALWVEFEQAQSADAKFAKSLDRLQPLLQNVHAGGGTWIESAVTQPQVCDRYGPTIRRGAQALWDCAFELVRKFYGAKQE